MKRPSKFLIGFSVFFASLTIGEAQVIHIPGLSQLFVAPTININSIGVTSTDGLRLKNNTAATAGAQQYSPRLCFDSNGWKTDATAASQNTVFCFENRPVQAAANPQHGLVLSSSVNGAAFVDLFAFSNAASTVTLTTQGSFQVGGSVLVQGSQLNLASGGVLRSNGNGTKLAFPTDGEVNITDNAGTNSAGLRAKVIVEANTATKTPTALESNEYYTNTGDSDGSAVTLTDDPPVGLRFTVMVTAAQTITITKNTGETLKFGTSTCGTSLTSNAVGSAVTIVASTGGSGAIWIVISTTGTWTCNA